MRYAVTIVWPKGSENVRCFLETGETLVAALRDLGHEADLGRDLDAPGQHIILGPNILDGVEPPPGAILYNLEQIVPESPIVTPELLDLYRRFPVWDHSEANADALERLGVPRPRIVPMGWTRSLERIPDLSPDIDVLFYGAMSIRRLKVIAGLSCRGVNVRAMGGIWGEERDGWIARSRLVLNVHFWESGVFEAVRVSYLIGNGRVVVSERGVDWAEESNWAQAVAFAHYDDLADRCVELLKDDAERARRAEAGRRLMRARDLGVHLRAALEG